MLAEPHNLYNFYLEALLKQKHLNGSNGASYVMAGDQATVAEQSKPTFAQHSELDKSLIGDTVSVQYRLCNVGAG